MTCELHRWNQPCAVCAWERHVEDEGIGIRMYLGSIGGSLIPAVALKLQRDGISLRLQGHART